MGQLEDMNTFIRIVDAGSITRASEQMHIAKSAVSRRLIELEERLGAQLMIRTTRQSHLTNAGRDYYNSALTILENVEDLNNKISCDSTKILRGQLKISVPLSFGLTYLSAAILDFSEDHPQLNIQLGFADRFIDMVEEGYDLAIRIGQLQDSTFIAKRLLPLQTILCASPNYLKKQGNPKNLNDLKNHAGLLYGQGTITNFKVVSKSGKQISITPKIKMLANNGDFLRDAVVKGQGIALLPTFLMKQELLDGKIIQILPDYKGPDLNAYAVYPQTRHVSLKVRTFIDFLKDWLDKNYEQDHIA